MKNNSWVTWGLLLVIVWQLEKQKECACDSTGPGGLPCTAEGMNTSAGTNPDWIRALSQVGN